MYLPLAGFNETNKKRGVRMSVGSVGSSTGMAAPSGVKPPEPAEASPSVAPDNSNNNINSNNNSTNSVNTQNNMSTEDFLSLRKSAHGSSAENMMETVKDVMALKMLEKTLEAINKIMED
jgi:hypothetical protein